MSRPSTKRLTNAVQAVTYDELGGMALFSLCRELARSSPQPGAGVSLEEHACAIVEANRDRLLASIETRRKHELELELVKAP